MTGFIKNVFISHIHEDDHGLAKLKRILSDHNLDVRDSSINSSNPNNATSPEYIKSSILAPQIQWASTLIVYVTADTRHSEWVNWESNTQRSRASGSSGFGLKENKAVSFRMPSRSITTLWWASTETPSSKPLSRTRTKQNCRTAMLPRSYRSSVIVPV